MKAERTIKCTLFDLLDDVSSLLTTEPQEGEEVLVANKIEGNLEHFIENFLLQFFRNGYGIDIDGVNKPSLDQIKRYFRFGVWRARPDLMIRIFEDAIEALDTIQEAVYQPTPNEEELVSAYKKFIPSMLEAFKKESEKIQNSSEIIAKIDETFEKMRTVPDGAS